ncbi:unnamed protein product [Caenorhabditis nigoni]
MRLLVFSLLLFLPELALGFESLDLSEYNDLSSNTIIDFYDNEIPDIDFELEHRRFQEPIPKTGAEMMARFNRNFLNFLSKGERKDWNNLMQIMSPDAYIETCMASAYGLSMDQFYKWMTYLSKFYLEVGLTSTVITDSSDGDITTELVYRSDVRGDIKRSDKWTMSATFDKEKGHFVVNTLKMMSDCSTIPKTPPLEPAIPVETFISSLKNKLVSDIFLDGGLHYKSAYESMYNYLNPSPFINICDVGKMSANQFVEYWNKRYGKVQKYMNHTFEVTHTENKTYYVDFSVTYQGEPVTFYKDRYKFQIQKWLNFFVDYFENFMDWTIIQVQQYCTENKTKMSKSDESLQKMALSSRRWDQVFRTDLQWNTQKAFKEMFDQKTFNGYACGGKFDTWTKFEDWLSNLAKFYGKSVPMQTSVYAATQDKLGFWVLNQMTAWSDNSTSRHRVYFEGYYKDNNWQLNHLGFACNE